MFMLCLGGYVFNGTRETRITVAGRYTYDMDSASPLPINREPTQEEYLELQNPREELSHTQYYPDLDTEELLPVFQYANGRIYSKILENSEGIQNYSLRQGRIDQIRQNTLKIPNFRKISKPDNRYKDASQLSSQFKTTAILEKLGFYNIKHDKYKALKLPETYFRPDSAREALVRGKLMYNSKTFQVYYNMDETDLMFLNWINEVSKENISMEQFEIIITFFEIQIYQIEKLLPPTIKDRSTIDFQQQQFAMMYGSDDGKVCKDQDEQECAVCGSSECDNTNAIIFCDGCDIAVHQDCYGVSFIPEGPWLCRRCLIARNQHEKCIFCPSTTGAFKQTDGGDWAHVLCTLWTPELYFANPIYMEPIEGISSIPKSRWKLTCSICRQKVGVCIQCSKPSCFTAYHVTCAKRAEFYMKYKKGVKAAASDNSTLVSYCDKHAPEKWTAAHDVKSGVDRTRLYFHDREKNRLINNNILDNELSFVSEQEYNELLSSDSEKFRWRLKSNIYVIPSIVIKELLKFVNNNKLPKISELILNQFAKYYTMKREYMGKPLIKRPDVFNYATLPESILHNREEAVDFFAKDVGSLLELSKLLMKRSKLEKTLIYDKIELANILNNPKVWIFDTLLSFFKEHLSNASIIPRYSVKPDIIQIIQYATNNEYRDIDTLIQDIERFSDWVLNLHLNENSSLLELQKVFKSWQRFKKPKYQNARDTYKIITENWQSVVRKFEAGEGLSYRAAPNDDHIDNKNGTVNPISNLPSDSKSVTEANLQRKLSNLKKLGIDVSEFADNEALRYGRHLRTRRSTSANTENLEAQNGAHENEDSSSTSLNTQKIKQGKLRARLNRVKLRTSAQNLRRSSRIKK